MSEDAGSQQRIEQFLFHEAELLDDWRLPEWAELYTDDSTYEVTSPNAINPKEASASNSLFLVCDRKDRIEARAVRLMKNTAHAEFPHSKTRHLVTNVRPVRVDGGDIAVKANFCVYRTKEEHTVMYMGEYHYVLVAEDGEFRIRNKRCILDLNSLYEQGRLTIIL